jgi:peroxiredoxin
MNANRGLAEEIPYITTHQEVEYFDLTGVDESRVTLDELKKQDRALAYVFSRPCSPCNKNLVFWNKMAQILGKQVKIYGVVLGDLTEAYNFSQNAKLFFDIYVPDEVEMFVNAWKIRSNQPLTILLRNGKPALVVLGLLEAKDSGEFIKRVRDKMD